MSGIVGIVNFDGAPVDRALLSRMTAFMDFRGPDARQMWIGGQPNNVGFGHTLLRTTFEAEHESQPFTFEPGDHKIYIVADCRIDAREELISKLRAKGRLASLDRPDVENILHAWHVWGEDCVHHLLGDFAFAIWDAPNRKLFCARDHLGVKPFYYAQVGATVIFSNTLDCVRLHPSVSDELNDLAIADYLLFGSNQEKDTTTFADLQRIAPAHTIVWNRQGSLKRLYWTLPIDEPVYFKKQSEYPERFKELLKSAVSDRLRVNKVGVFMSGGLDSTTLAATASLLLKDKGGSEVHAFTSEFGQRDPTRYYAELMAQKFGLRMHYREGEHDVWDPNWRDTRVHTPEPSMDPMNLVANGKAHANVADHVRVAFWGEGPDNALTYEWRPYLAFLAKHHKFRQLAADVARHLIAHRRVPLLPTIPRMLKQPSAPLPGIPGWLDSGFIEELNLQRRWELGPGSLGVPATVRHEIRPCGYGSFAIPQWQSVFEGLDPSSTGEPCEVRQPFTDLRMLRFLLSVPALPWCRSKYLVRTAMKGILPEPVRIRPKAILEWDPVMERAGTDSPTTNHARLRKWIRVDRIPQAVVSDKREFWTHMRPHFLDYWLDSLDSSICADVLSERIAI